MRIVENEKVIYLRQSWLNDVIICPERARFKIVAPHMSGASDATIMGTAVHHAIETVLAGGHPSLMVETALTHWEHLKTQPYKTTSLDPDKGEAQITSMCQAFIDDILPNVVLGGSIEMPFKVPTNLAVGDYDIWYEGTMDYVDPNGVVWDWKTASRPYYLKEKQSQSIQATVYAHAVATLGMTAYPVEFRYGVMLRQEKPKAQIGVLSRTHEHNDWLMHTIKPIVQSAMVMSAERNWIMNDTSALCSEKWCDYWSLCKGSHISPPGLSLPLQTVSVTKSEPVSDTVIANTNQQGE